MSDRSPQDTPDRRAESWSLRRPSPARVIRTVGRGCAGGVVATVVMTVYRIPVFKALPPTAEFWAEYVGSEPAEEHFLPGLFLHFAYGLVAGGIYGLLVSFLDVRDPVTRERASLASGLGYGLALSAVGSRVVFVRVLGRELQTDHALVFHVAHAVYGLTLGTWMASREGVGEVYEESEPTRATSATERGPPREAHVDRPRDR